VEEITAGVRRLLPGWRVLAAATLEGSDRAVVQRLSVLEDHGGPASVVAKLFTTAGEGPVREAAALSSLPPGLPVPRLLAEQAQPPLLVMTDVGAGPSVADALLGGDPRVAEAAVSDWAAALAAVHAGTLGSPQAFAAEIGRRAGDLPVAIDPMAGLLDDAAAALASRSAGTGVRVPARLREELGELARRLTDPGHSALSPSDACPDNNVRSDSGVLSLVDFEDAAFRHVAWDVAYLTVPWPSCWCCWRIPKHLTRQAVDRYCTIMRPALPWAGSDGFWRALDRASVGWAVISTGWFLNRALDGDPPPADARVIAPPRRSFLLHRLAQAIPAAENDDLPAVTSTLRELHARLLQLWGPRPLADAPAFH
jgi:hypothetical protein